MGNFFTHVSPEDTFERCNSPECVRCNKYASILGSVPERLQEFKNKHPETTVSERLEMSLIYRYAIQEELDLRETDNQHPNVFYLQELSAAIWWAEDEIGEGPEQIKSNFQEIRDEFSSIYADLNDGKHEGWMTNSTPHGTWCVFHLVNQGLLVEENCARCPKTFDLLQQCPDVMIGNMFGNATFSVLYPGTHITPHYGPCNLRIRCHLGLTVPEHCSLTVNNETRFWETGQCLSFDDSFFHEARHDGDDENGPRAVLMVDFWHPSVTEDERTVLNFIFPDKLEN